MRSKSILIGILSLLFILSVFSACQMEPDPIKYNVTIQAPSQASLTVTGNSIGTETVHADDQRGFLIKAGETLQITINFNSSENNYSVYQWNGATKIDELTASAVINSDTVISVIFREQFTISFTAPDDSGLSITKDSSTIKTIEAGNTDTVTDWIGTELYFTLDSLSANHEIVISSGDAEKVDRYSGTLEISSDDSVILSSSLMPFVTLVAPESYPIMYRVDDLESSLLSQGDTISVYIPSGSTLTASILDLDVHNFEVTDWSGLTPNSSSNGTRVINANSTIAIVVSQIRRTLSITEPSINAYVKVFESSDLTGSALTGTFQNGTTSYSIGSGDTIYLSAQNVADNSFISWGSTYNDSNESPLVLAMDADYTFTPAYLSSVVEPGIAYVSTTGLVDSEANGSKGLPFRDIQAAIDSISTGEVRIAEGTYEIEEPIEMRPGVSLVGSYSVENHGAIWSPPVFGSPSRGLGLDPTTNIVLEIIGAGTSTDYLAVAKFSGSEFTDETKIRGISFEYDSLSRSYVAGLLFENGASPTIEHCNIISGNASQSSQGIRSVTSSPTIKFSSIQAGEASSSIGIYNSGSIELVSSEVETSFGGSNTIGMQNNQATEVIVDNSSISSQGLNSSGFYGYSYGIHNIDSSSTIIDSNIMAKGGGPTSSFGATLGTRAIYENSSNSVITGNSIQSLESAFAGSGVAYYATNSPSVLINNQISTTSGASLAYGLYLSSSNMVVAGNVINVGRITSFGGPVYGIYSSNSNPLILNNSIEGGDSGAADETSYGIYLGSGSAVLSNNILYSKASRGPRYGIYSSTGTVMPKHISHNAFFDLTTAWFAPQGATGVYYVTQASEFTTSRTGLDESKMIGNIGEPVGTEDPLWSTTSVFNGYSSNDYSLNSGTSDSLKFGGVSLTSSLIQAYIDELGVTYSVTSLEVANLISYDLAQNERISDNWSMGALQY